MFQGHGPVHAADYMCAFKGVCICVLVQVQQVRGAATLNGTCRSILSSRYCLPCCNHWYAPLRACTLCAVLSVTVL
jgi:hypothetical protein